MNSEDKRAALRGLLWALGRVAVAFSGGTDSSLLAAVAADELGQANVVLVRGTGRIFPRDEATTAREFAVHHGLRLIETNVDHLLETPPFVANSPRRCYYCRRVIIAGLRAVLDEGGLAELPVVDGANADDLTDHRPGAEAAREAGVRHPLQEAGLTKAEIRAWARDLGLTVWDKPASPCLASRIPYGREVTVEALERIDAAEARLHALGFRTVRVRHHGDVARIEVPRSALRRAFGLRRTLSMLLKEAGYQYVCLDLDGFRSGALNEVLSPEDKERDRHAAP